MTSEPATQTPPAIFDPFPQIDPNERVVTFVYMQCRACEDRGPAVRSDDHATPDGSWDYEHRKATGHDRFYLFTLTRQTARLF